MLDSSQSKLVIKDRPLGIFLFGLIFFIVGLVLIFIPKGNTGSYIFAAIFGGIGLFILLIGAQTLTITLDKTSNQMTLHYWAPLWQSKKELALSDIASMQVESSLSRDSKSHRTTYVYRVVVVKKDASVLPLRDSYSSGEGPKRDLADKIGDFLGLSRHVQSSGQGNVLQSALAGVQAGYAQQQNILAGAPVQQEQLTNGVHWHMETHTLGASPVTRWISPDFTTPGYFVLLSQKVGGAGVNDLLGGSVGRFLTQQALSLYGLSPDLTPGLGASQPLPNADPQLTQMYETLTNLPDSARQVLNPWVTQPLVAWAQQYPAQQLQAPDRIGPLMVVFSPQGLYLTFFNLASGPQVQALTQLGVDLVRAQGSSPTNNSSQQAW